MLKFAYNFFSHQATGKISQGTKKLFAIYGIMTATRKTLQEMYHR